MNPYFTLFGKDIPYYGILFMLGLFAGAAAAIPRGKKYGVKKLDILLAACFAAVGGIVGAKLLSVLTSINIIIEYKLSLIEIIQNGFVFYGGLIGGIAGLFIYVKVFRLDFFAVFDIFAVSVPLGHAMGRVGCFISGCCYGIEYDGLFSFTYTQSVDLNTPIGVSLLPVQLIESFSLLCLYGVLEIMFRKVKISGVCLLTYAAAYSVIRFTLEFFRGDVIRGFWLGLSTSQWISIALFVCAAALLAFLILRERCSLISRRHSPEFHTGARQYNLKTFDVGARPFVRSGKLR